MNRQLRAVNAHRRKILVNRQPAGILDPVNESATATSTENGATATSAAQTTQQQTAAATTKAEATSAANTAAQTSAAVNTQANTSAATSAAADTTSKATTAAAATSASSTPTTSSTPATNTSKSSTGATTSSTPSTTSAQTTAAQTTAAQTSAAVNTSKATRVVASASVDYTYVTNTGSQTSSASSSATLNSSNSSSGGVSTGTLVGGIGGAIVGIAVVSIVVAFLIRKFRQRRNEEEHFSASQFRRSAVLLDDEFNSDPHAGFGSHLRPPTMIERHVANTPAFPAASYGNYGSTDQYGQYNQYPAYGETQQYSFAPGEIIPSATPAPEGDAYANPIAHAHSGSAGSAEGMDDIAAGNAYLNRQPTVRSAEYHEAGIADHQYVDMNRVASPPASAAVAHDVAAQPVHVVSEANTAHAQTAPAPGGVKRPDTVYDPEDAYGGM